MIPEEDGEWGDCQECCGSGRDESDELGRCLYCHGKGTRFYHDYRPDDDGDDCWNVSWYEKMRQVPAPEHDADCCCYACNDRRLRALLVRTEEFLQSRDVETLDSAVLLRDIARELDERGPRR
jgi:hypothetical protein